nr:MAG TPA: hypothetical protein [Caudoviricetes sp.]
MDNPQYVKIKDKKYKINSDFRVALKCNKVAKDSKIDDTERALAIIYLLFGEDGLNSYEDWTELIRLGQKYLLLGKENKSLKNENDKPDFDYEKDKGFIRTSFIQDYGYNPYEKEYLHWWDFWNDLNGLSNSEFGNCCILNRVRNLRNLDLSKIKDYKEREKAREAQKMVALDNEKEQEREYTEQEERSINNFYKQVGINRKEE